MSSVAEIVRLQSAIQGRASRWMPVIVALQGAESMALEQLQRISVYRAPYTGNDARDKREATMGAFKNTFVETMPASRLVNHLFSGVGEGLDYFRAIFNNTHGGRDQTQFQPQYAPAPEVNAFRDIRNRFERTLAEVVHNLDLLKRAIGSETKVLPTDHVRNAFAVMLLSPILYPPSANPDADKMALAMEWHMWLFFLTYVLVEVQLDVSRERAHMTPLVDMTALFARMIQLLPAVAGMVRIPDQLRNLNQFRQDWEQGRINQHNLSVRGTLDLPLAVSFPPGVKKWMAASGGGSTEIAKNAQRYVSAYEARI